MTKPTDPRKLIDWHARLARYRSSGLTVARFCKQEKITVASFYYWTKRSEQLRLKLADGEVASDNAVDAGRSELANDMAADVVQFWFNDGLRVVLPARCLDAIRCLLDWSRDGGASACATSQRGQFKQVVVASR